MQTKFFAAVLLIACIGSACRHKAPVAPPPPPPAQPAAKPAPKQNLFVLLPEPDGKPSGITVTNQAGSQTITQPNQEVRVESATTAPAPPVPIDAAEVQRLFGTLLADLPAAELAFTLHFDTNSNQLDAESSAQLATIAKAIQDRHSTAISIIGHTDTTGASPANYQLGLRRAQTVADTLRRQGVAESDLFVESHGDADLLVKTGRNVAEAQNRRVEVIVR
jgi:outer membrane protein OmpA-like peptidoglycan-associated protein